MDRQARQEGWGECSGLLGAQTPSEQKLPRQWLTAESTWKILCTQSLSPFLCSLKQTPKPEETGRPVRPAGGARRALDGGTGLLQSLTIARRGPLDWWPENQSYSYREPERWHLTLRYKSQYLGVAVTQRLLCQHLGLQKTPLSPGPGKAAAGQRHVASQTKGLTGLKLLRLSS